MEAASKTIRTRMSAGARREDVLRAALSEFAVGGLHGTSTDTIARRAGVSQPYLFRLFGTKKELFLACVERCFDRTRDAFEEAAARAQGEGRDRLEAMGEAYVGLLSDRELLLGQMQTYAACADDQIRAAVRDRWSQLYQAIAEMSGASAEETRAFVAHGMLLNVAAAIDLPSIAADEEWVVQALRPPER